MTLSLSNKAYDAAKYVALVALPALGTGYAAVASIWHLPRPEEVVATIVAVDTALGALLHLSTKDYQAQQTQADSDAAHGDLIVSDADGERNIALGLKQSAFDTLTDKGKVVLNVVHTTAETSVSSEPPPRS